ncbi:integrase, partial [Mesorhizobium sp. M1423]
MSLTDDAPRSSAASGDDDMPDIIDVVMEMDDADHGSSPPLPAIANPSLPAHLEALAGRARDYIEAASSANTRRAYAADWKHFSSWCRRQ